MKFHSIVSEEKIDEIVDVRRRRTTNDDERRRTTDIQGITKAHPEHSSGELKKKLSTVLNNHHNGTMWDSNS